MTGLTFSSWAVRQAGICTVTDSDHDYSEEAFSGIHQTAFLHICILAHWANFTQNQTIAVIRYNEPGIPMLMIRIS